MIYKGFLDRFLEVLEEKLIDLNYILGLFNLEEVILVLGIDIEWERLENKIVWILFKIFLLINFFVCDLGLVEDEVKDIV